MRRSVCAVCTTALAAVVSLAAPSARADFDVSPGVSGNKIVTGAFQDSDGEYVSNVRVFGAYGFGDGITQPFFTEDPGFHPQPGSGFLEGVKVTVAAFSGLTYWDGSGPVSFGALPNAESLLLEKGSGSLVVTDTAPGGSLTVRGSVPADGEFDEHLSSTIQGNGVDDPTAGIYLLQMQLSTTQEGVASSDPFYVLFNLGREDEVGDEASLFIHDTYVPDTNSTVPEPACLGAGIVLLAAMRRRTRN